MEIKCSSCGAASNSLTTFRCEFCGTVNNLNAAIVKQIKQAKQKEIKLVKQQKTKIEEKIIKEFNFVPESQQVGAIKNYPKYIVVLSITGIVMSYAIFACIMWLWYQSWYLNWDYSSSTFLGATSYVLLYDEAWVFLLLTLLTIFLLFKGFHNALRMNFKKVVFSLFISILLASATIDLIALIGNSFEESMVYLLFIDGSVFYRWTGEMLMMYYLIFSIIWLFITHRFYKKSKIERQEAFGISMSVDLARVPKLNPSLGFAEIVRMGILDVATYEQALIILLTANIPFNIARDSLESEGLDIEVDTIKERLRNPFAVELRT